MFAFWPVAYKGSIFRISDMVGKCTDDYAYFFENIIFVTSGNSELGNIADNSKISVSASIKIIKKVLNSGSSVGELKKRVEKSSDKI